MRRAGRKSTVVLALWLAGAAAVTAQTVPTGPTGPTGPTAPPPPAAAAPAATPAPPDVPADGTSAGFAETDVLAEAENVFGRGAEGLAEIVRKTFRDRGEPNAYIVGREAGGAFIVGLRYGSGTLHHKVEGERPVHWTGPSVGFDIGGSGSKVFALVYNLDDTEDLFRRFPAAEGKAYIIGGFSANYMQRGRIIIVPIKMGVGWRLGLNAGYMKFSRKGRILPF